MDLEKMLKRTPIADRGISAVIPTCNEGNGLVDLVVTITSVMEGMGRAHEIIVADNGSVDQTGTIAVDLAAKNRHVRVLSHPSHQGYGASLRAGFRLAKYPLVLQIDSGNQYDFRQIDRLLREIDEVDIVCGYRQPPTGSPGRLRYWLYRKLLRFVFAVHVRDVDCGFRLYRRSAIRRIPIQSDGSFANAEILAKATFMNMLIGEVAVTSQSQGVSAVNRPRVSVFREAATVFRHPQFRISNSTSDPAEPVTHTA